ncbi:hypothetical protein Tco_0260170 [Tanacetum coccineum]
METVSDVIMEETEGAVLQGPGNTKRTSTHSSITLLTPKNLVKSEDDLDGSGGLTYKLINDMRNIKMTYDPRMNSLTQSCEQMLPEWSRFHNEVILFRRAHSSRMGPRPKRLQDSRLLQGQDVLTNAKDQKSGQVWMKKEQTLFLAGEQRNTLFYDEAGTSYDSNTPSEVHDHDTFVNHLDEYHEVHEMQTDEQHNYVVDSMWI